MAERTVGHERLDPSIAELDDKLLNTSAAIAKYQPLLAVVQPGNDQGGIG